MFPFIQCQCFDKRRGVYLVEKVSVFTKIRVLFWSEISALGVFFNFDNERMRPPKYPSAPPPGVWLEFGNHFCHFFVTKRSSLPSKLGKPLSSTTTCMYKHTFCLSSAKCWVCSLVPIVKCEHCRHYDLACLSVANNTNTRDRIVGNGHILQWDLMSKLNILRSWDKKYVYTYT